jgi:hypothetical protein
MAKRTRQKFHKGDRVFIAKDLGPTMKHFDSGVKGTVVGSYADQYPMWGSRDTSQYTIDIDAVGQVSWYYEHQLTLLNEKD